MEKTKTRMTSDQFITFLDSVPPGADIERIGNTVRVSAVKRATGIKVLVIEAVREGDDWIVECPPQLIKTVVVVVAEVRQCRVTA